MTPIVVSYKGKRFISPNDFTIGFDDIIYFTDPNWNTPSNIDVTATLVTELVPALGDKPRQCGAEIVWLLGFIG